MIALRPDPGKNRMPFDGPKSKIIAVPEVATLAYRERAQNSELTYSITNTRGHIWDT